MRRSKQQHLANPSQDVAPFSASQWTVRLAAPMLIGLAFLLPGCSLPVVNYSGTFNDTNSDQPWAAPGERVSASVRVRADPVRLDQRLIWTTTDGREYDADRLVERCEAFLRSKGLARDPQGAADDGSPMPAHRWGSRGEALIAPLLIYPDSPMIVCVEPLIVVVCPEPRTVHRDEETPGATDEGAKGKKTIRHTLQHGYQRGTHGACAAGLQWYSPDLDRGPEPVAPGVNTTVLAYDHWGSIAISVTGEAWSVAVSVRPDATGP